MTFLTKTYRRTSYPAISPTDPKNNQSGRTVLISGGSSGIGLAIARAFVQASARCVIILGRRADALSSAITELQKEAAESTSVPVTSILSRTCDVASKDDVGELWAWLGSTRIFVDVLVLNAVYAIPQSILTDIQENSEGTLRSFEVNVFANLRMTKLFVEQGQEKGKVLLNISSAMAHANPAPQQAAYSASKGAMATLFQHLADEVNPEDLQVLNIHPGAVFTEAAARHGMTEDTFPWDNASLSGSYCVWASTKAAALLHGKFVWANWDVEELEGMGMVDLKRPGFLRLGLQGPSGYLDIASHFEKIREIDRSKLVE